MAAISLVRIATVIGGDVDPPVLTVTSDVLRMHVGDDVMDVNAPRVGTVSARR